MEKLTYKNSTRAGAMVALFLPPSLANRLALPGGEPAEELHITLAYLGKAADIEDPGTLLEIVRELAEMTQPFEGVIQGVGRFCNSDSEGDPFILLPDFADLSLFRELFLVNELQRNGIEIAKDHGFTPHITLKYIDENDPLPLQSIPPIPLKIDRISVVLAEARHDFLLDSGRKVERIGARHTRKEYEMIQKGHDLSRDLGAACKQGDGMAEKAGARHSLGDQKLVQRIHDDFAALGAMCQGTRKRMPMSVKELTGKARAKHLDDLILLSQAVTKAQSDAPNYRPASTIARCENCRFFRGDPGRDWCERFDFAADKDYVCGDWAEQRPSETPGLVAGKADLAALAKKINKARRKNPS